MGRSRARRSPRQNTFFIGKNEPARATPIEASGTLTFTPAISQAFTSAPIVTSAIVLNPDNELFKKFMKAYLEAQTPA